MDETIKEIRAIVASLKKKVITPEIEDAIEALEGTILLIEIQIQRKNKNLPPNK